MRSQLHQWITESFSGICLSVYQYRINITQGENAMNEIKLKVMEWNLHGMTGFKGDKLDYYFPSTLIIENIERLNPDIIVFTEFCSFRFEKEKIKEASTSSLNITDDAKKLKKWFDRNCYTLKYSTYNDGENNKKFNNVGIAIKNSINIINNDEEKVNIQREENWPDYLGVYCEVEQSKFYVMGVRIQTSDGKEEDIKNRKVQFDKVIEEIKGKKPVIVLGDFNNGTMSQEKVLYEYMKSECENNELHIYTPGMEGNGELDYGVFSYTYRNSLMKIDHMITSFDAKISDLNDRKQIGYDWGFIGDVYNNLRNYEKKINSFRNIPDHAIFYAEITLPEND